MQAPVRRIGVGFEGAPGASSGGAEGGLMAACRLEVHHSIPRCLLDFYDRFAMADLDSEGLQAWFEWEGEAFRYGVDPDVSREELELLIEASTSPVPTVALSSGYSRGGDFARWGRRGGLRTLALYGRGWFVLLAGRRWEKITAEQLADSFAHLCRGRTS
jgi:hypothetical protein